MNIRNDDATLLFHVLSSCFIAGILIGSEAFSLVAFLSSFAQGAYYDLPTNLENTLIAISVEPGAIVGCIFSCCFHGYIGSVRCIQVSSVLWIAATLCSCLLGRCYLFATSLALKGFCMGILSSVLPGYACESLAYDLRGSAISLIQLGSAAGLLLVFATGFLFQEALLTERSFRLVWALELVPAFALLLFSLRLKETSVWLARTGQWAVAANNLRKIQKHTNLQSQEKTSEQAVGKIDGDLERDQISNKDLVLAACEISEANLQQLVRHRFHGRYRKHLFYAVLSIAISQLSGVTIVMRNFSNICHACGIRYDFNFTASIVQNSLQAAFTMLPVLLLDKCRRKDVMVLGIFGIAISYFACWIFILLFGTRGDDLSTPFGKLVPGNLAIASTIIALTTFVAILYSITLPTACILYACELLHGVHRVFGLGIAMGVYWLLRGVLGYLIPNSLQFIGGWTWLVLASLCFAGGFIFTQFPETLMLNSLEIELLFEVNEPASSIYQTVLISDQKSAQVSLSNIYTTDPAVEAAEHTITALSSEKTNSGLLFKERLRPDLLPLQLSDSTDESWNIGDEWVYGSLRAVPAPKAGAARTVESAILVETIAKNTPQLNELSPVKSLTESPEVEMRALPEYPTVRIRDKVGLEPAASMDSIVEYSDGTLTTTNERAPHLDLDIEMAEFESSEELEGDLVTTNASADQQSDKISCRRLQQRLCDTNSDLATLPIDEQSFSEFYNKSPTAHGDQDFPDFKWLQQNSALL